VLAKRRKVQRDRLRFDDVLLKELAAQCERDVPDAEEEALALKDCMKKLPDAERALISRRYDAGVSVKAMAADLHQSPGTVAVRLHRIRHALLDCMRQRVSDRDLR
jgi:RNA polymerase sigma-70 factor (ECF subfamily)